MSRFTVFKMKALRTLPNFIKRGAESATKAARLSRSSQISSNKIEKIKKSLVSIGSLLKDIGFVKASGVIFKEDKRNYYILTAAHVVEKSKLIFVKVGRDYLEAEVINYGPKQDRDIGLIKISKQGIDPHDINIISLAESDVYELDPHFPVIMFGYDFPNETEDYEKLFRQAEIKTIRGEAWFETDGVLVVNKKVKGGFSGGPVIDIKGRLVGIVHGDLLHFVAYAVPINIIKKFIEESLSFKK